MGPQGLITGAVLLLTIGIAPQARTATYPAYAEVVRAEKIVQPQQTRTPVKRCTWEQLPSRVRYEPHYGQRRVIARRAKRCRTTYESRTVAHVTGYNVTLRYNGTTFSRHMPVHPGTRVPITVDIHPLAAP